MLAEEEKEAEMPSNAFAYALNAISQGDLADQASEAMTRLVKDVEQTGKTGKLTLTIEVKPRGRDAGQVEVSGKVSTTPLYPDTAPNMFFVTEDGHLVKDNPRQMKLPFGEPKAVNKPAVGE
jgi:hypothetical protein